MTEKLRAIWTIASKPVSKSRIETLKEYMILVASRVGLFVVKVDTKGEDDEGKNI
jgi:hypothetical protein